MAMTIVLLLAALLTPTPAQVLCCSRADGCSALPASGFCPDDKTPHVCSDELTCEPDGSACWYECKPLTGGVS